jgi:excisionase family DNA binding protein
MALSFEGMITVAEAAGRLGRSQEQVRRYLREGKLRGQRIGGQWFVEEASLGGVYPAIRQSGSRIAEPVATREMNKMTKSEVEALIKKIEDNREAIRKRIGGNLDSDIVEMLRQDRNEH